MKGIPNIIFGWCLLCGHFVYAQNFEWAKQEGSTTGQDYFTVAASNLQGSALMGGEFTGTISFSSNNYTASGTKDLILMSYDSTGTAMWSAARQFLSTGNNDFMADAAYDSLNNRYYVTGKLSGSVMASAQTGIYHSGGSFFVARITAGGTVDMLFPDTALTTGEGTGVAVDNAGNVYVSGQFRDSITLGSTKLYSAGGTDGFVLKLSATGAVLAVRHIYGTGDENAADVSLSNSEVFVAGNFNRPAYFTPTDSLVPNVSGVNEGYLVKYGASTMSFTAALSVAYSTGGSVNINGLFVDKTTGRAAITGHYTGTLSSGSYIRTSSGGRDIFTSVVRPIPFGVAWAKAYGGIQDESGIKVRIGETLRNVFVYGQYASTQFVFGTADTLSKTAANDHFLMTWSALGDELGAVGGTMVFSTDQLQPFGMDIGNRKMYISGGFRGRADFGTQGIRQSLTSYDAFGAQIAPARIYCKINQNIGLTTNLRASGSLYKLCDLDTAVLVASPNINYNYVWYDGTTAIAGQTSPFLEVTDTGDYYVLITDTAKKCTLSSDTVGVRIDPLPSVVLADTSVCAGSPSFSIVNYSPFGGIFAGSGITGNVFNPGILQPDTYSIVYAYTAINTCVGTDTADFIIQPRPALNFTTIPVFCNNGTPEVLNFVQVNRILRDSFYTTVPGQVVSDTLFPALLVAGTNNTVRYFVLDSNGCSKDTNFNIYVEPKPNITHAALPSYCGNEGLINLTGGNPTVGQGAFYSGRGVLTPTGQFHTDTAGSGNFDISYHFIKTVTIAGQMLQCADSIAVSVQIDTVPQVSFVFTDTVCRFDGDFAISGGWPQSGGIGVYSGTAVASGQFFSPVQAGVGQFIITYTFTDFNTCSNKATDTIFVRALPVVTFPYVGAFCENAGPMMLNTGTPVGGQYKFYNILLAGDVFDPANYGIGTDSLRYIYTDVFGCVNESRAGFTVVKKPFVSFPTLLGLAPVCANTPEIDLVAFGDTTVTPPPSAGGFFTFGAGDTVLRFLPSDFASPDTTIRDTALYYIYRDGVSGCSDTLSQRLKVYPSPKAGALPKDYTCANRLDTLVATGGTSYLWNNGHREAALLFQTDTPVVYSVTVTNDFACLDSGSFSLDIRNGTQVYAKRDSLTMKRNATLYFDPVARLFPTDTIAVIGSFEILERPQHYTEFSVSGGVSTLFNSQVYYQPETDYRRLDSIRYRICNIECPDLCDSDIVVINVLGDPYDFIPNGFSPNDDGLNDTWVVPGIEAYPQSELYIYNQWGDLIFEAVPYLNNWAGQTNKGVGGGKKVGDGTYFYVLITGEGEPLKGSIELKSK
ncbi:MAG: gliding motility-associated C-terminal domain-containing protein [Flavobacteriales bacterium]|nr:gliding motility-associated C-terminal domain-containing protein [Flavobacteriales bacterium]